MSTIDKRFRYNYKWYHSLIYAVPIFILAFGIIYHVTVLMAVYPETDYKAHIAVAEYFANGDLSQFAQTIYPHIFSYPLFHVTTAALGLLLGDYLLAAFFIVCASLVLTVLAARKLMLLLIDKPGDGQCAAVDFFAVISVALSRFSGLLTEGKHYLPYGSFNVWHNPTYIFMRPFALLATIGFIQLYRALPWKRGERVETNRRIFGYAVLFAAALFFSVLAKPNFALFFLIAAGLICAVKMLKTIAKAPWQVLGSGSVVLLCVLPSMLLMLWQKYFCEHFTMVKFSLQLRALSDIFSLGTLRGFCSLYLLPTLFFLYCLHRTDIFKKEPTVWLAYLMLSFASFIWYGTVQGIEQWTDYSWSYYYALYFVLIVAAALSIKYIRNDIYWVAFSTGWCAHLYFGLQYMHIIFLTGAWNI